MSNIPKEIIKKLFEDQSAKLSCPQCKSTNIAKILHGLPVMSPELQKDLDDGKVVLGGCTVFENMPHHHCNDCDTDF